MQHAGCCTPCAGTPGPPSPLPAAHCLAHTAITTGSNHWCCSSHLLCLPHHSNSTLRLLRWGKGVLLVLLLWAAVPAWHCLQLQCCAVPCCAVLCCAAGRTLRRYRTTTGSDTTMKALGPNSSLYTPPDSMNLPWNHAVTPHTCVFCEWLLCNYLETPTGCQNMNIQQGEC